MLNPDAPLPDDVYIRLTSRVSVLNQGVKVDATRWQQALHIRRLPMPVGKLASSAQVALTRADVYAVAEQDLKPDAGIQLLWHTLAWGLGRRARHLYARLDAIADDQDAASKTMLYMAVDEEERIEGVSRLGTTVPVVRTTPDVSPIWDIPSTLRRVVVEHDPR